MYRPRLDVCVSVVHVQGSVASRSHLNWIEVLLQQEILFLNLREFCIARKFCNANAMIFYTANIPICEQHPRFQDPGWITDSVDRRAVDPKLSNRCRYNYTCLLQPNANSITLHRFTVYCRFRKLGLAYIQSSGLCGNSPFCKANFPFV